MNIIGCKIVVPGIIENTLYCIVCPYAPYGSIKCNKFQAGEMIELVGE